MVNKILVVLIIVLLGAIIIIGYLNYTAGIKAKELKAQYEAMKAESEAEKAESLQEIEQLRNIIAQKDREIRIINAQIEYKQGEISTLHEQTTKLESAYATLVEEDALNYVAKIDNLTKQVELWKQKFTLAQSIIYDKDAIIFGLTEKYEAQEKISLEYKTLYENELALRELAETRLKIADRRIRGLRIGGTIKTGFIVGLAAVVVYGLAK